MACDLIQIERDSPLLVPKLPAPSWDVFSASQIIERELHSHSHVPSGVVYSLAVLRSAARDQTLPLKRLVDWAWWASGVFACHDLDGEVLRVDPGLVYWRAHNLNNSVNPKTIFMDYFEHAVLEKRIIMNVLERGIDEIDIEKFRAKGKLWRANRLGKNMNYTIGTEKSS
jgi:hypothetical protein